MASLKKLCLISCLFFGQALGELQQYPTLFSLRPTSKLPASNLASTSNSNKPSTGPACGETLKGLKDGDYGVIESPGYPNNYKPGVDCEWRIEGEPGTVIQATVFELKTESAFLSDASDSLFVSLNGNWNDSQRFSGDLNSITPLVLISEQNTFGLRFRSSRFTDGNRGFRIAYHARSTGKPAASEPGHDVWTVVSCNYIPVDHPQVFPAEGESFRQLTAADATNDTNPNPFLVALVLDDQQFCSGTLVSNRHVVTSAHCTRGVQKLGMVFGTDNILVPGDTVQRREASASSVTEHPYFDPYTGANDLSVITLTEPVEINKFVVPASIPSWSYIGTTFGGFRGEVVGWGDSKTGTVYAAASRKRLTISPNAACANNRGHNGYSMCSRGQQSATCQADSGSPIINSRAYCNGPVDQNNNGDNAINNSAQKPTRPQKPNNNKPNKPSNNRPDKPSNNRPNKPSNSNSKPGKPNRPQNRELEPKYQANVLLGVVSYGSCDKGFSFTRITAYLDFLTRIVGPEASYV